MTLLNFYILIFKEILLFKLNYKKSIFIFFSIIIIIILTINLYINIIISSYDSNRILKIRTVPIEYRISLLNNFIHKKYNKDSIILLGDSQTNGYLYPDNDIFSTLLSKKLNMQVLNYAFPDARILDNIYILKYMKNNNMKVNTIIYSVDSAHLNKIDNFRHLDEDNVLNYQLGIIKNLKPFLKLSMSPTFTVRPILFDPIDEMSLPNDYFYMDSNTIAYYSKQLIELIQLSKDVSTNIIIYVMPYSKSRALSHNKNSINQLDIFQEHIKNISKKSNVNFFEPSIYLDDDFFDIVHFNLKGHERMANDLFKFIQYGKKSDSN